MAQIDLSKVRVAGSEAEVREMGLDPSKMYCCGPASYGVAECPIRAEGKCTLKQKDATGFVKWIKDGQEVAPATEGATRQGPGPLNVGITLWKRKGSGAVKLINRTSTCWEAPHAIANWAAANFGGQEPIAGAKITAIEGDKFHTPGSKPTPQEDGRIIHVRQPEGVEIAIKPYPRPRQNPMFLADAFAVAEVQRDAHRMANAPLADYVRLAPQETKDAGKPEPPDSIGKGTRGGASSRG